MKKIFLLALLFCSLSSRIWAQAQHGVGASGSLTPGPGITLLSGRFSADTAATPTVSAYFYGAKGDGVTDDYAALSTMIAACGTKGYTMILPHGTYLISLPLPMKLINSTFRGADSSTKIVCNAASSVIKFTGDFINSHIQNLILYTGFVNATQDFGNGPVYSVGYHNWHSSMDYVTCKAPYANVTGINFLVQAGSSGGSIYDLHLTHFRVDSCGGSGVSILSRNYATHGDDSCTDVFLEYFYIGHLGFGGNNGTGVTLDGNGKRGKILHGIFENCYDINVENTGYDSWEFGWLDFKYSGSGSPLYGFSFDPQPFQGIIKHCWVHDIHTDSLPNTAGFFMRCSDLVVERCTFLTNGGVSGRPAGIFRNCSNYVTRDNHYGTNSQYGVEIQDGYDTSGVNGIHTHETVDNGTTSANTALIWWTGPNIRNDKWEGLIANKGPGGSYTLNNDSANNNYVTSMSLLTDTTALASMITYISLPDANYTFTQDQDNILSTYYVLNGTLTATRTVTFNNVNHNNFSIFNNTNQSTTIKYGATGSNVVLPAATTTLFFNDGTTLRGLTGAGGGGAGVSSFNTRTGAVTPASGDYTAAQVTNAVDLTTAQTLTNKTLTSPTLTTPALGTPASGVGTNLTGIPISTGISGLGTGVATFLATPSSANLATAVTGETGSGALVFGTSPTLVTPALGTPASAVLTNATGLPIAGITGLGTGVGTALAAAVTGSGSIALSTSPSFTTPALGTPTSGTLTNTTGFPLANLSGAGTGVLTGLASAATGTGGPVLATSPTITTGIFNGFGVNDSTATGTTLTLVTGRTLWTFTGSSAPTWTFPLLSASPNAVFVIKNKSAVRISLATSGSDRFYGINGPNSFVIQPGESYTFINDGVNWAVMQAYQPLMYTSSTSVSDVNYTLVVSDNYVLYTALTAARTATLPAANGGGMSGKIYVIKDMTGNAATNNITVAGTIDGATNKVINTAYGSLKVFSNGTSWFTTP